MSAGAVPVPERTAGTLRLMLTLAAAGLLSGLIIVSVYELTLPRITANREAALQRAVFEVLPGAERMQPVASRDGRLVVPGETVAGENVVYAGYDAAGACVGFAIPADGPGFQDTIALLFGWNPGKRRVVGLAILESRETPGLGDKIFKDQRWLDDFRDLAAEPEIVVIKGGASAPHEIDAITGATISSKAVANIINGATGVWIPELEAEAPAAPIAATGGDEGGS